MGTIKEWPSDIQGPRKLLSICWICSLVPLPTSACIPGRNFLSSLPRRAPLSTFGLLYPLPSHKRVSNMTGRARQPLGESRAAELGRGPNSSPSSPSRQPGPGTAVGTLGGVGCWVAARSAVPGGQSTPAGQAGCPPAGPGVGSRRSDPRLRAGSLHGRRATSPGAEERGTGSRRPRGWARRCRRCPVSGRAGSAERAAGGGDSCSGHCETRRFSRLGQGRKLPAPPEGENNLPAGLPYSGRRAPPGASAPRLPPCQPRAPEARGRSGRRRKGWQPSPVRPGSARPAVPARSTPALSGRWHGLWHCRCPGRGKGKGRANRRRAPPLHG